MHKMNSNATMANPVSFVFLISLAAVFTPAIYMYLYIHFSLLYLNPESSAIFSLSVSLFSRRFFPPSLARRRGACEFFFAFAYLHCCNAHSPASSPESKVLCGGKVRAALCERAEDSYLARKKNPGCRVED